jgi:membrane-associated phospholipid phosphatase
VLSRRAFDRGGLALALVLLTGFVLFTALRGELGGSVLDRGSARVADAVAGGPLQPLFAAIEPFGSPFVSTVIALALGLALARSRGLSAAAAVVVAFVVLAGIEGLLRVRIHAVPWSELDAFLRQPHGWGLSRGPYPSGHTARLALLAGIAAAAFVRSRGLGLALVVAVTALIGIQRVESNAHGWIDVAGGALLGWGLAAAYAACLPFLARRTAAPQPYETAA